MSGKEKIGGGKFKTKKHPCDWKGCSGSPHPVKPKYEDRKLGCNTKKPIKDDTMPFTYSVQWTAEKHPYKTLNYPRGSNPPKVRTKFNYRIQRHHVIPGNMLDKYPDLFFNAMLMGWNHNSYAENGINLPWYDKDVVWNDLQAHRGSHSKYDTEVARYMKPLQAQCKAFCKNKEDGGNEPTPEDLLGFLFTYVETFREEIVNWNPAYVLKGNALTNRKDVFTTWSDKKRIPKYPKREISI